MNVRLFVLNVLGEPAPADSMEAWVKMFADGNGRVVAQRTVGQVIVSTVFLGISVAQDLSAPLLWETKIVGGELDGDITRCSGPRANALAMHEDMVKRVEQLPFTPK